MTKSGFAFLPGSECAELPGLERLGAVSGEERVDVTVVLPRRAQLPPDVAEGRRLLPWNDLTVGYGADPGEAEQVRSVLSAAGWQVLATDLGSRRMEVCGPARAVPTTFGVSLERVRRPESGTVHRYHTGGLWMPADLSGRVQAVLGLDTRPVAHTRFRVAAAEPSRSYTPPQLGDIYRFPDSARGNGQSVAVIELGGGYTDDDLDHYFDSLGLSTPSIKAVGVDGGKNDPGSDSDVDVEVALDVEIVGALAPHASQTVYFAPNTSKGFVDAISKATHADPTPAAISISWGQSEDEWSQQDRSAMNDALADAASLGITVACASGDAGSTDSTSGGGKPHVDFPASSPHVLGCGGTHLEADPDSQTVDSETVWNSGSDQGATGGGVSDIFDLPSWQEDVGVPTRAGTDHTGRGVPDVAAVADPATGYEIYVDSKKQVIGGTSAAAPLWAALAARLAEILDGPVGSARHFYTDVEAGEETSGYRDITSGDNGDYEAAVGWDACTGLGSPDGDKLATVLGGDT